MQWHTLASLLSLSKPIMLLVLHLMYMNKRTYVHAVISTYVTSIHPMCFHEYLHMYVHTYVCTYMSSSTGKCYFA